MKTFSLLLSQLKQNTKVIYIINNQEYITTKLKKTLEKMIILSAPHLNNLTVMVIEIICSQSVVLSKISQELKDNYSLVANDRAKLFRYDPKCPEKYQ